MTLLLIAISFLGSLAFTVMLRRMDKPGVRLAQIKRIGELQTERLEEIAAGQVQSIKDSTLEYEVLIRQSRQMQTDLKNEFAHYQEKIDSLKEDRELIENISGELGQIAGSAATVGEQVERLDMGLSRLGFAQKEIAEIQEQIKGLYNQIEQKGNTAHLRLDEIIGKLVQETEDRSAGVLEQVRASFRTLETEGKELEEKLGDQFQSMDGLSDRISNLGGRLEEKWSLETGRMHEKFSLEAGRIDEKFTETERNFQERIGGLESGLTAIRSAAVDSIQSETARIRSDLDNFNLETIAKRDELLNDIKKMAEGMADQLNLFQEKYITAESKLTKYGEEQRNLIARELESFQENWAELEKRQLETLDKKISGLGREVEDVRERQIDGIAQEANRYRDELKTNARELSDRLEKEIQQGQETLRAEMREEERELAGAREELSQLRDNLSLMGHELKATVRGEADHCVNLLKDTRKNEEEQLVRGREELRMIRDEMLEQSEKVAEQIRRNEKLGLKLDESAETARENLAATRDEILEELESHSEEYQETRDEQLTHLQSMVDKKLTELDEASRLFEETRTEQLERLGTQIDRRMKDVREIESGMAANLERVGAERLSNLERVASENVSTLERVASENVSTLERVASENVSTLERVAEDSQTVLERKETLALKGLEEAFSQSAAKLTQTADTALSGLDQKARGFFAEQETRLSRFEREFEDQIGRLQENEEEILGDLEKRGARFLSEQDDTLGRLSQTMDQKISRQIALLVDNGRLKLEEIEKRTAGAVQDSVERMEDELGMVRDEFKKVRGEIQAETGKNRLLKEEVFERLRHDQKRMEEFGRSVQVMDKAEDLAVQLDSTLEVLTERLQMVHEENKNLDEYVRNLEDLRFSRKEMESELKMLETQRNRLSQTEKYFEEMEERMELLSEKFETLNESEENAENLGAQVQELENFREVFEKFFAGLGDRKKFIENGVRYIEKARQEADEAKVTAENLFSDVERAQLRQEELEGFLGALESRSLSLGNLEKDIQKVEARFEQMEGLLMDLENKHKQIGAMSRKTDELKNNGEELRQELDSMLGEADEKMDRLTAFFQTIDEYVDSYSHSEEYQATPARNKGGRPAQAKKSDSDQALSELKRNGILSLYLNHKWEADLIAQRMRIDPATVRAVIAGHARVQG